MREERDICEECTYRIIAKLELEGRMSGIGGEGLEGLLGHANDHGALCQWLGRDTLASKTLERDCAIDGNGERHKGDIVRRE